VEKHTIEYDGQAIHFIIHRKKVKNVNLRVYHDSSIIVSAHENVPYDLIEKFIYQKAPWIIKNINRFDRKRCLDWEKNCRDGDYLQYLGRQYRLIVNPSMSEDSVLLGEGEILLFVNKVDDVAAKGELLDAWFKRQAKIVFQDALDRMLSLFNCHSKLERPKLTIRTMKTRWGSCSWNKQKITLNTRLIAFPLECIEYVVLHELVHFIHQRHNHAFYDFLSSMMPEWKTRRKKLGKN